MGEIFDKMKGKVKQTEGGITGDRSKQAGGYLDELKGKAKEKIEDAKSAIRREKREHDEKKV